MLTKHFETKVDESGSRTVVARISTAAVDRDGDVMLPSGVDLEDFRKNPVVLFGHDSSGLPVAKAPHIWKTSRDVRAKVVFAERPASLPKEQEWVPDTVHDLFKQGVLSAFSVGFSITDARDADTKDRARFGDDVRRVIRKWKLLEFSVVPVPANQDALAMAVSKGMVHEDSWTLKRLGVEPTDIHAPRLKMPEPLIVRPRRITVPA